MGKALVEAAKFAGVWGAWLLGGGALVMVVFVLSFYGAMKLQMRSTEVVVPELTGATEEMATRHLSPLGLHLEVADRRHDPAVSSGRILQQDPAPGSPVRRGRRVKVVVSLGGKVLSVPEVVGRPARTVDIVLRREGFSPGGEASIYSYDVPRGSIVAQVPPPGSPAVPGERVHRLVSLGPAETQWVLPDLSGRLRRDVERWLQLRGFRLGPARFLDDTGRPSGVIVGQLPLPGYPVRRNDVVQLTIAR